MMRRQTPRRFAGLDDDREAIESLIADKFHVIGKLNPQAPRANRAGQAAPGKPRRANRAINVFASEGMRDEGRRDRIPVLSALPPGLGWSGTSVLPPNRTSRFFRWVGI
jgi:hypothetical protein